jgi:two-component system CheB/CheR fusion protein
MRGGTAIRLTARVLHGAEHETMAEKHPKKKQVAAPIQSRTTAPADPGTGKNAGFPIVGIGSSAGGLKALKAFIHELPANSGAAFVIVQHLAPNHKSMLGEILAGQTSLTVHELKRNIRAQPNAIYIIPAGSDLSIKNGVLRIIKRDETEHHLPIDRFLTDLANDQGANAVAVIFSGVGADGAMGIRHVRAAGGVTFAQEPGSAEYTGMPEAAIATGCTDFILAPGDIPAELMRVIRHPYVRGEIGAQDDVGEFERIIRILHTATNVDYSGYKKSTVNRRIAKRMAVNKIDDPKAYTRLLQADEEECEQLRREILIHVTEFFRDPDAFAALEKLVFPRLTGAQAGSEPIRVWVPGCASGEEAYSVGCLLLDHLARNGCSREVKVFATDLSDESIATARAGVYPRTAGVNIEPRLLQRYFTVTHETINVGTQLREICIFARQDVANDPPFSNIGLVTCRNVLIYFNRDLQRRVIERLHYALTPPGCLMLGSSEKLSQGTDLFQLLDRKHRIYSRRETERRLLHYEPGKRIVAGHGPGVPAQKPRTQTVFDLRGESERLVMARYGPAGFLLDPQLRILDFRGNVREFLSPMPGEATFDAMRMMAPEIVMEVDIAAQEARATAAPVRRSGITIEREGKAHTYELEVLPVPTPETTIGGYLVLFSREDRHLSPKPATLSEPEAAGEIERLKATLARGHEHVRSVLLEHDAYTEELKAANEEIMSSNEELQSTNEELETAKEELQAANEELSTVNEELENRNDELDSLASDLNNVLIAVDIPIVLVDRDLRVRRFTPPAADAFNLIASDIGRPIANLQSGIDLPNLYALVSEVVSENRRRDLDVQDHEGRWFSLRLRPNAPVMNRIDGALIALIDIDASKRSAAAIIETMQESLLVLDGDSRIESVNPMFCQTFELEADAVESESLFTIGNGRFDTPQWRDLLECQLRDEGGLRNVLVEMVDSRGGKSVYRVSGRHIVSRGIEQSTKLVVINDVTNVTALESELRYEHQLNASLYENLRTVVLILDAEGRVADINPMFTELTGHEIDDLRGREWFEVCVPAGHRAHARLAFDAALAGSRIDSSVDHVVTTAGTQLPVEWYAVRLVDSDDKPEGVLCVGYDLSDRYARESKLRATETQLRALTQRLVQTQEEQVRHLARELHDDFTQQLAALSMTLGTIRGSLGAGETAAKKALDTAAEQAKNVAEALHDMSRRLHPSVLDDLGLAAALSSEADAIRRARDIPVTFASHGVPVALDKSIALCLYRVAQECLRNIRTHAEASAIYIELDGSDDALTLVIRDVGDGFDLEQARHGGGLGLISMDERISSHGGVLEIESEPDIGTVVRATVPLGRSA